MTEWQIALGIMVAYLVVARAVGLLAGRGPGRASVSEFTTAGGGAD